MKNNSMKILAVQIPEPSISPQLPLNPIMHPMGVPKLAPAKEAVIRKIPMKASRISIFFIMDVCAASGGVFLLFGL